MLLQEWTGEKELADALLVTAERLPGARFVITTLGRRGSIMLSRSGEQGGQQQGGRSLKDVLSDLEAELGQRQSPAQEDCISRTGLPIRCGSLPLYRIIFFISWVLTLRSRAGSKTENLTSTQVGSLT